MAIFLIAATGQPDVETFAAKVRDTFPLNDHYEINPHQFLVAGDLLTQDVSKKLGLEGGQFGLVLIVKFDASAGWHKKSLWEWIKGKEQAK
jgi:hypothetical protein